MCSSDLIRELDLSRYYLKELVEQFKLPIGYRVPECSYFGWLDLRSANLSGDIAQHFINKGRIAIAPGNFYGPTGSGFIRINFATSRELILDAITRISKVLT